MQSRPCEVQGRGSSGTDLPGLGPHQIRMFLEAQVPWPGQLWGKLEPPGGAKLQAGQREPLRNLQACAGVLWILLWGDCTQWFTRPHWLHWAGLSQSLVPWVGLSFSTDCSLRWPGYIFLVLVPWQAVPSEWAAGPWMLVELNSDASGNLQWWQKQYADWPRPVFSTQFSRMWQAYDSAGWFVKFLCSSC